MTTDTRRFPTSRRDGLLCREIGDEIVVYDLERHRAHSLNRAAWLVWERSDGTSSAEEIAAALSCVTGLPADPEVVELSWRQLIRARLVEESGDPVPGGLSRRDLSRRLGLAAALAVVLPLVSSIVIPTPAEAQSPCVPNGGACMSSAECCSGCCKASGGGANTCKNGAGNCL